MQLTKEQKSLLRAIRERKADRVRTLLQSGKVSPNFPVYASNTPLHEAVKAGSLPILKILVDAGADVSRQMWDGTTAEDFARSSGARADILNFLKDERLSYFGRKPRRTTKGKAIKKMVKGQQKPKFNQEAAPKTDASETPEPPKPVFTAKTLPEIFAPEKWAGHTQEMQALWDSVPAKLKKDFDFAAALSDARQQKLRDMPKPPASVFAKKPKPPEQPPKAA